MNLTKKYMQYFFNLLIVVSLCLMGPNSALAQSLPQALGEEVSPPLSPDLTWKDLGNIQKNVHGNGQVMALNGTMFESANFNSEKLDSVFEYYSAENLQSLGWEFVGGIGVDLTYVHTSGRYLTVQIAKCEKSGTDFCVNVWQSIDIRGTTAATAPSVAALIAFNKISPTNGAAIPFPSTTYSLLTWGDAQKASTDRYQYCIDETNNSNCDANNWITRNSLYSGGPGEFAVVAGHTYYWQVRLRDADTYANNGTWWSFKVATSYPVVKSILRFIPSSSATTAVASVAFAVTFDSSVTGVDVSDFTLTAVEVTGASVTGIGGSGTTYTVLVNTGTGSGTIRLNVVDDDTIKDSLNRPLGGTGVANGNFNLGELYTFDRTPPTVLSSVPVTPGINLNKITYTVTFSESVTGVTTDDFLLTTTGTVDGATITAVSGSGSVYTVTVKTGTGTGTIRLDVVAANGSILDALINALTVPFSAGTAYTLTRNLEVYSQANTVGRYTLGATQSLRDNFASEDNGPLKVLSMTPTSIMASERVLYKVNGVDTSYSEMMGVPASLVNTTYWFPWYNNVTLDTQLRLANVSGVLVSVHVYVGGVEMTSSGSPFALSASGAGQSVRVSFAGVNNGPVRVVSNVAIVASERVLYKVNGVDTSFTEMMGLPASQLDTTYWFPWYNNVTLDTQLRLANVSGAAASVQVSVGGTPVPGSPFSLTATGAGQSTRVSFAGVNDGPVEVVSTQAIVASERVLYNVNGVDTSYSEMLGLPAGQLTTTYWLPWYNNTTLDTQLRLANVSGSTASVQVFVGGVEMVSSPFSLTAGLSTRVSFTGVNSGPVKIVSNVAIVASERVLYKVNGVDTSFTEMMALPDSQLNSTFWFPWYNNVTLDTQLRFAAP